MSSDDPDGRCSQCNQPLKKSQMGGHRYYYLSFGSPEGDKHKGSYFVGPATTPATTPEAPVDVAPAPQTTTTYPTASGQPGPGWVKCSTCGVWLPNQGELSEHKSYSHSSASGGTTTTTYPTASGQPGPGWVKCSTCGVWLPNQGELSEHRNYEHSSPASGPAPVPPAPTTPAAPVPTQQEQEASFYAALNSALDSAKAGDPQPLRNFDNFFGVTRPEYEYSASFYVPASPGFNEQQYLEMYPDVAAAVANGDFASGAQHYQTFGAAEHRLMASAPVGYSEEQYLANNPDVAAAVQSGQFVSGLEHYQIFGASEGRVAVFQTVVTPPPVADVPASVPEAPAPDVTPPSTDAPGSVVEPDSSETSLPDSNSDDGATESTPESTSNLPEAPQDGDVFPQTDDASSQSPTEQEQQNADQAAAQEQQEEENEAALATATEAKHSAKESRMKKLMSMRKPWSSGVSSSNGSESMVAPPITPSSQIPPPPL